MVIAIIALLVSILVPCLQRVRKQAKATNCQSNLRQSGLYFAAYAAENDGKLNMDDAHKGEVEHWDNFDYVLEVAGRDWARKQLLLCPMATRPKFTGELEWVPGKWYAFGDTFSAWTTLLPEEVGRGPHVGSYGFNLEVSEPVAPSPSTWYLPEATPGANNIPVYMDCASYAGIVDTWLQEPAAYEGAFDYSHSLSWECINRHDGGINCLFLDWSVRKVGLKELWTLKWNWGFDTHGPWTKRGGVQPEDWPQWMRGFKDY